MSGIRREIPSADDCDLCGGTDRELLATVDRDGQPLLTGLCKTCGMVAHWQCPTEAELDAFYTREYREAYHGERTPSARRVLRAWKNGQRIVSQIRSFVRPGDTIFEVGAGIGCNVKAFELEGFEASGIDPGEGFQRFSHEQLLANVRADNLFDIPATPEHDVVLLIHVIEHFRSPRQALQHIHGLLKPGGRLYVECPNRGAPFATRNQIFHFAHVSNFTANTLRMLAARCGFRELKSYELDDAGNLQMLFEKVESTEWSIDPQSSLRTVAAMTRYNRLTYSLRPSYLSTRAQKLWSYLAERIIAKRWLKQFVARCHAEKRSPKASGIVQRRVA